MIISASVFHFSSVALQFALLFLLPRQFGLDGFTQYMEVTALGWICSVFITRNANDGVSYYTPQYQNTITLRSDVLRLISIFLARALVIALVTSLAAAAFLELRTVVICLFGVLLSFSRTTFDVLYRVGCDIQESKYWPAVYPTFMNIMPIVVLLFAFLLNWTAAEYILTLIVASILSVAFIFLMIFWRFQSVVPAGKDESRIGLLFKYGEGRIPIILTTTLLLGAPVLLSDLMGATTEETAQLAAMLAVLRVLSIIGQVASYVGVPKLVRLSIEDRTRFLSAAMSTLMLTIVFGVSVGIVGTVTIETMLFFWIGTPVLDLNIKVAFGIGVAAIIVVYVVRCLADATSEDAVLAKIYWLGAVFFIAFVLLGCDLFVSLVVAVSVIAIFSSRALHLMWMSVAQK